MKYLNILLILSLIFAPFQALAAVTEPDRALIANREILKNNGFENGKVNWTASGGTFLVNSASKHIGNLGASWDSSSASQTLKSDYVALSSANNNLGFKGQNGIGYCQLKAVTTVGTHTIKVVNGDGVELAAAITPATNTTAFTNILISNFIYPNTGNSTTDRVAIWLTSVAANEPEVLVDTCSLRLADNIGTVNQSILVDVMTITGCSSNFSSVLGANTTFASMTTNAPTGCTYTSKNGIMSAPSTMIPAFKIAGSLGAGDYAIDVDAKIVVRGIVTTNTGFYQFTDGTTTARESSPVINATTANSGTTTLRQSFSYTAPQSNKTWDLFSKGDGSTGEQQYVYGTTAIPMVIKLWYSPSASQQVVSSAQADYSGATYDLTSSNTQGIGTPTSAKCIHDRVGGNLLLNCKFTVGTTSASEFRVNLPNGLVSADTNRLASTSYVGSGAFNVSSGITPVVIVQPSVSYVNFSWQYEASSFAQLTPKNGNDIIATGNTMSFSATIPIQGWASSNRAPVLNGSSTSNANYALRTEVTTANCSTSSSVTSGDFLSSPSNISSGVCTYTMSSGWSSAPKCTFSTSTTTASNVVFNGKATSATSLTVTCSAAGTACSGGTDFNVSCTGAR